MTITTATHGDVTTLRLHGNVTLGDSAGLLRDTVRNTIANGVRKILIDLGEVSYIDSAGLGELVGCYATAENKGAELKLLNLQKRVQGLMQITKLITVFDVYEDEAHALRAFQSSESAKA
jgi:anti-sigma B factor antagonist